MCQFTKKLSLITVFAFLHSEVITHQALWQHIFLIGIHYMLDWTATARHGVKEKEAQKDQIIQEICLERIYSEKLSVNSRLQGIINAQKLIFHAKHKFCIILNYSSSPNLVLKSHKICSEENHKKSRHNKNAFFSLTFLLVLQTVKLYENIRGHTTSHEAIIYTATKRAVVKMSSQQKE